MKQRTSQILFAYWNEVRGDRLAPRRFEIEPSRISSVLAETFILERTAPDTLTYRLAGTRICEMFGAEFRGRSFLDGWSEADRAKLDRHVASMCLHASVAVFDIVAETAAGRPAQFELLLLPLLHTADQPDRFLGTVSAVAPPDWLGTEPLLTRRITHDELVWPDGRPHALLEKIHRQAPFIPQPRGSRIVRSDRRQFRVYDGGRLETTGEK